MSNKHLHDIIKCSECENIMYEELVSVGVVGGRKSDNKTFYEMLFYTYTHRDDLITSGGDVIWDVKYLSRRFTWETLLDSFYERRFYGCDISIEALHFPLNVSALIVIFSWSSCNWDEFEIKFLISFFIWMFHDHSQDDKNTLSYFFFNKVR